MIAWLRKLLKGEEQAAAPPPADAIEEFRQYIVRGVAAGFDTPEEVLAASTDAFADEIDVRVLHERGPVFLAEALAAHAAAQAHWPARTDCDRLDAAFAALEVQGVIARQNFSCCGTCGSQEIWDEVDAAVQAGRPAHGYAFYHIQDTESAAEGYGLYLNYGASEEGEAAALAVGHEIVGVLEAKGLATDWNGSWDTRIHVSLDWKRRRPPVERWTSGTVH